MFATAVNRLHTFIIAHIYIPLWTYLECGNCHTLVISHLRILLGVASKRVDYRFACNDIPGVSHSVHRGIDTGQKNQDFETRVTQAVRHVPQWSRA